MLGEICVWLWFLVVVCGKSLHVRVINVDVNCWRHEPLLGVEVRSHVRVERGDIWHLRWRLHEWGLHLG